MPHDQSRPVPSGNHAAADKRFPWYHAFISHTGAQKFTVAFPIRQKLCQQHPNMSVFVDEESLRVGDDAVAHMKAGLAICDTAVVVLSPEYVRKRWPMWELHILLRRVLKGEAGLLVVLYDCDGTTCLEELASKQAPCYTKEFWGSSNSGEDDAVKAPGPQEMAMLQQWALDPANVEGCSLIHPDQWTTIDELTDLVEAGVADLLHARGQLPPRLVIFSTIPPPLWPDLEVRQGEARKAEAALLEQRYVELRGGPGEGKSTLAQYLTEQWCARWQRSPPDGVVGKTCLAVEVDLRGLGDASLKEVVASQVLAAAVVVGLQPAHHSAAASPLGGQQSSPQDSREQRWLDFMSWVLSLTPRPLLLLLENAEDAAQHGELLEVVARLRALPHVHLIVATRAQTSLSQQLEAPAELCVVDLGVLDTAGGLRVAELHLGRELRLGDELQAARKLVEAVQANPLFCGVAACLVNQTGRTWEELLELCAQDMAQVRPADGRAGGMGRRLVLLQRWLRSALGPQEQLFLAHIAVFAGSFTEAGAAAMQLPSAAPAVAIHQELVARELVDESRSSCTDAGTADVPLHEAKFIEQQLLQQQQQRPSCTTVRLLGEEAEGPVCESSPITGDILQRLQLLSLIRQLAARNEPGTYHMGSRWMMHALVQQAASKLLQDGGDQGHSHQTAAADQRHGGSKAQYPAVEDASRQLDARFTEWMLWCPEGPGQVLVRCDPTASNERDAQLMWYLLGVEQANLHAAADKLPLTDLQAARWQGELGIDRAWNVDRVGAVLTNTGRYKDALQLRRCMVTAMTLNHGATHVKTLTLQSRLAVTHQEMGQLQQARQLGEEVLAAMAKLLGPEHPTTLSVKNNLASTLQEMGHLGEAHQLKAEVLTARTRLLGRDHPDTVTAKSNLANTLQDMGRLGEARELRVEVLAAMAQSLGPEHPKTLSSKSNLASTLLQMGHLEAAKQLEEEVLAARMRVLGPEHPDTLSVKSNLANTLQEMGQLGEVQQLQEEVLAARTQLLGPGHPDTLSVKSNLAITWGDMGQLGKAQQLQEEILAARTQLLGPKHPETLGVKSNLANTLHQMGQLKGAQQLQEEVLEARSQLLGPEHPDTLGVMDNLAITLGDMGQLGKAQQLQQEVLAARTTLLGPEHPDTFSVANNLVSTLLEMGQLKEARQLINEFLVCMTQRLGPEHPNTLSAKSNLATTLAEMGQLGEAQQLQEEVLEATNQLRGPEHADTLSVKSDLASTLDEMGLLDKARQLKEEVLAARTKLLGPEHPHTLDVKSNLANTLQEMGQLEEAQQLQEAVLAARARVLGHKHPDTLRIKSNMASILQEIGQLDKAHQLLDEALAGMTQVLGPEHPHTLAAKRNLASTLEEMGQLGAAQQLQEQVLTAMAQRLGTEHPDTLSVKTNLACTLHEMGQLGEARQLMEEVLAARTQLLGPDHPDTLRIKRNLACTLQDMGQTEEAAQLLAGAHSGLSGNRAGNAQAELCRGGGSS